MTEPARHPQRERLRLLARGGGYTDHVVRAVDDLEALSAAELERQAAQARQADAERRREAREALAHEVASIRARWARLEAALRRPDLRSERRTRLAAQRAARELGHVLADLERETE